MFWEFVSIIEIIESKTTNTIRMTIAINWRNQSYAKKMKKKCLNVNVRREIR